jgi:hypothetical protein
VLSSLQTRSGSITSGRRICVPCPLPLVPPFKHANLRIFSRARVYDSEVPRDPFSGDDELLNIEGEPDEALKVLLGDEVGEGDPDVIEPVMDE